jgi:hypothetical protein
VNTDGPRVVTVRIEPRATKTSVSAASLEPVK